MEIKSAKNEMIKHHIILDINDENEKIYLNFLLYCYI